MNDKEFVIADQVALETLLQQLIEFFHIREIQLRRLNESYYDTFDWRLYGKGCLLKKTGRKIHLQTITGAPVASATESVGKRFFADSLSTAELQDKLLPVTGCRALCELFVLKRRTNRYDLLNRDKKTVVRLFYEEGKIVHGEAVKELEPLLRVAGLKGYGKQHDKVIKIAEAAKLQETTEMQSFSQRCLAVSGRQPGDYSSSFTLQLEKDITMGRVCNKICLRLVQDMETNFPGVLEDIDSEFLHDFRVAIRRARSFLGQFRKKYQTEEIQYILGELKWLGSVTGPVRDADVYLLMKKQFAAVLPAKLHPGLNEFFIDLAGVREEKLKEMLKALTSQRYKKLMSVWKKFLQDNGERKQDWQSDEPCRPWAVKKIEKRFKKIVKDGGKINRESPNKYLHELRKDGKKLRYLLEFFSSFFDESEVTFFRKQLKRLQNNLGDFNDISVQQGMLMEKMASLAGRTKRSVAIAAAVGGLLTHLEEEHGKVRGKFEKTFARFTDENNIKRFVSLFA